MSKIYAVLIVIFFIFYFADRAKRRRARNTRDNKCVRCGAPHAVSQAPVCRRCTRRDTLVRTAAWSVAGLALAATVALFVLSR
jgi:uncharacterized paraquat-inducible protein A